MPLPKGPTEESGVPEYANFRAKLHKGANSSILDNPGSYTSGGSKLSDGEHAKTLKTAITSTSPAAPTTFAPETATERAQETAVAKPTEDPAPYNATSTTATQEVPRPVEEKKINAPVKPTLASAPVAKKPLPKGPTVEQTVPEYADFRSKLKKSANSAVLENPGAYSSGGTKLHNAA